MLVIRMQRTGRRGHAQFRVVVQDSRRTPTSGKIVASLGSFDPHSKQTTLNKEKAQFYLEHGAQPSDRVVRLLKSEGLKLPQWVSQGTKQERAVRNPDKRRSTRPAELEAPAEAPAETEAAEAAEAPAESETSAETAEEAGDAEASEAAAETADKPANTEAEEPGAEA